MITDPYARNTQACTCCVAYGKSCAAPLQTAVVTDMFPNLAAAPVAPPLRPGCLTAASRLNVVCVASRVCVASVAPLRPCLPDSATTASLLIAACGASRVLRRVYCVACVAPARPPVAGRVHYIRATRRGCHPFTEGRLRRRRAVRRGGWHGIQQLLGSYWALLLRTCALRVRLSFLSTTTTTTTALFVCLFFG